MRTEGFGYPASMSAPSRLEDVELTRRTWLARRFERGRERQHERGVS